MIIKTKKGASWTIPFLIISLVTISMVITGSTLFMSDIVSNYGVTGAKDYSSFAKMEELQRDVSDISETFQNTSRDPSIITSASGVARGTWKSIWLTFSTITITTTMIDESIRATPYLSKEEADKTFWFQAGIVTILTIIFIGALWTLITKTPSF